MGAGSGICTADTGTGTGTGAAITTGPRVSKRPRLDRGPMVTPTDTELRAFAKALVTHGVAVLPLLHATEARQLAGLLEWEVQHAAEWRPGCAPLTRRRDARTRIRVHERHAGGGFGGVYLPSVNHGVTARRVREAYGHMCEQLMPHVARLLQQGPKGASDNGNGKGDGEWLRVREVTWYQLFDRAMLRDEDAKVGRESTHRDEGERKEADTVVFGGWCALGTCDGKPQTFRCIKGTGLWRREDGGFAKPSKAEAHRLEARMQTVQVPLGHCIIFDETILHMVMPSRNPKGLRRPRRPQTRVFTACKLSAHTNADTLQAKVRKLMTGGGQGWLKSGQKLPGYPNQYWGLQFDALRRMGRRLQPPCTEERKVVSGRNAGRVIRTPRHMQPFPSMVEQGLTPPNYTASTLRGFIDGVPIALDNKEV